MNWTAKQLTRLRQLYPNMNTREVAKQLGIPYSAVHAKASALCLHKDPGFNRMAYKIIRDKKREFVKAHYQHFTNHKLAYLAGCSESTVRVIAKELGLKKEVNTGGFKKGSRPWNFRTKGLVKSTPEMKRTQFKKGNEPENTLHNGAITVRLDHPKNRKGRPYKWIRVAKAKWVMYHRWLWEQHNGPVPPKHVVIFKDSNTMNTELNNLQLITMAENARRNYNPTKAQLASKTLTDNYIAGKLAGGDKKLRKALILAHPEIIETKRMQLQLKRELKSHSK